MHSDEELRRGRAHFDRSGRCNLQTQTQEYRWYMKVIRRAELDVARFVWATVLRALKLEDKCWSC